MIFIVKALGYNGIYHKNLTKEQEEILLSAGAVKGRDVYCKPSDYKKELSWKEYCEQNEKNFKEYYYIKTENSIVLTEQQYKVVFKITEVVALVEQDIVKHEVNINLDDLADKVMNKVIKNAKHLFNSKLEVHQPNMPLFQYNKYQVLVDCCTEDLQNKYIDNGWRVVCVCPQPDQRRPDYIIGKYEE